MEDSDGERDEQERLAPGRSTKGFFSDVVNEQRDVPDARDFRPELLLDEVFVADEWFAKVNPGPFDAHIACSIPTFFELVRVVAFGEVSHHRMSGLSKKVDLGASEGTLCAAVTVGSGEKISAYAVEPNQDMVAKILDQPVTVVPIIEALSPEPGIVLFDEEQGPIPVYAFDATADYYSEIMTFQFLGAERNEYVKAISSDLSDEGLFITCEKFSNRSSKEFLKLEMQKDAFKARYFDKETLEAKQMQVLSLPDGGMNDGMVTPQQYEKILTDHFGFVARFWDAGNFKGYVASNSKRSINRFLTFLPPLTSSFSTVETPFFVQP